MSAKKLKFTAAAILFTAILAVAVPSPAIADGGLIVPRDLWIDLEEGHQVGVVTIIDEETARIDLFISILDRTDASHEVTFFVPIGTNTSYFQAIEQDILTFDEATTRKLDKIIRDGANERKRAVHALFSGALLTNGAIFTPFWAPILLTGCGAAAPQPETVVFTESSQISVYGIDDNTDINALIETTGLPPAVADTLSSLKGQQVAIVKLQTKPEKVAVAEGTGELWDPDYAEPGLHLSWMTEPTPSDGGRTFTYPLGTGGAWASPIEITRLYINPPRGLHCNEPSPEIGTEHSGFDIIGGSKILEFTQTPSYAVDETRGDFGRLWRATYMQSNPTDDIVITVKKQSVFSRFLTGMEEGALGYSIAFAIIAGLLIWVFAWRLLMPVFLGKDAGEAARVNWPYALIYPAVNLVFIIFPGSLLYLVFLLGGDTPALAIQFLLGAGISIGLFTLIHSKKLEVSRGKAIRAFILTSLCSSAAYLVLAVAFAFLVNAL